MKIIGRMRKKSGISYIHQVIPEIIETNDIGTESGDFLTIVFLRRKKCKYETAPVFMESE